MQNPHDFASGSYLHTWGIGTNAAGAAGEQLLTSAQQGLQIGLAPQLSLEGSGGTYLLRDTQKRPVTKTLTLTLTLTLTPNPNP